MGSSASKTVRRRALEAVDRVVVAAAAAVAAAAVAAAAAAAAETVVVVVVVAAAAVGSRNSRRSRCFRPRGTSSPRANTTASARHRRKPGDYSR